MQVTAPPTTAASARTTGARSITRAKGEGTGILGGINAEGGAAGGGGGTTVTSAPARGGKRGKARVPKYMGQNVDVLA
ncbi:MAG: hypothetical protein FJX47_06785 [Alphaproteobacteria bacterium]|nr:hypothetical protein [Alphaproteobacteria bacterium]